MEEYILKVWGSSPEQSVAGGVDRAPQEGTRSSAEPVKMGSYGGDRMDEVSDPGCETPGGRILRRTLRGSGSRGRGRRSPGICTDALAEDIRGMEELREAGTYRDCGYPRQKIEATTPSGEKCIRSTYYVACV